MSLNLSLISIILLHSFFKAEIQTRSAGSIIFRPVFITFLRIRMTRLRMERIEELHNMESALVDIEMDIPGLEVGSTGLPDFCFRIQAFHFLPGSRANAFAVYRRRDK